MLIKLIALMLLGVIALVQHYRGNIIAANWLYLVFDIGLIYLIIIPLLDLFIGHRQGMYIAATVLLAIVIVADMEAQNINKDLKHIADHYGKEHQLEKCKEELNELIEAIDSRDEESVREEIADVEIMIYKVKNIMCVNRLVEI